MTHLDTLENEAIYILREAAAQFERPALLFSGGKDSITVLHLAIKAFKPGKIPFPIVHIDTGHNFPEVIEYRDRIAKKFDLNLIVRKVEDTIQLRQLKDPTGKYPSRNPLQTYTLLDSIQEFEWDACIGGARRDEEKARAKERIFSVRDEFGQWDPKLQRPELWNLLNGKINKGENVRVFPISNFTELDIWSYIKRENIELPSIYYAHNRKCIEIQKNQYLALSPFITISDLDTVIDLKVRFRTVGDATCTAPVLSNAFSIDDIIEEIKSAKTSERGATRIDDKLSEAAMEDRKKTGYF